MAADDERKRFTQRRERLIRYTATRKPAGKIGASFVAGRMRETHVLHCVEGIKQVPTVDSPGSLVDADESDGQ